MLNNKQKNKRHQRYGSSMFQSSPLHWSFKQFLAWLVLFAIFAGIAYFFGK